MNHPREMIDKALASLLEQLPGMDVERIVLTPSEPSPGQDVVAQIMIRDDRQVICEISPEGRLRSARIIQVARETVQSLFDALR